MALPVLASVLNPALFAAVGNLLKVITEAPDFDLRGGVRVTDTEGIADLQFYMTKTSPLPNGT